MSSTSIKTGIAVAVSAPDCREEGSHRTSDGGVAHRELPLLEMLSLTEWRRLLLETVVLLALITAAQRWLFGATGIPGLPHPYWLPVLLASCQYGISGGMVAAVAASAAYFLGLSASSASLDFYVSARTVAVQPALWLTTALVLGGLRNLHIHHTKDLIDQLAASRQRANDLSNGLERAAAEIKALERRIALDEGSAAALSRSLALIDMRDRRIAAISYGELFRAGAGTPTFAIYLADGDGYVPVWAIEEDVIRPAKSMERLPAAAVNAMLVENPGNEATNDAGEAGVRRYVVRVPSQEGSDPLAVIVCDLQKSQDMNEFYRRADELSRALATILRACPDPLRGTNP